MRQLVLVPNSLSSRRVMDSVSSGRGCRYQRRRSPRRPVLTQKRADFLLFKTAVSKLLLYNKKHLDKKGKKKSQKKLEEILTFKAYMNKDLAIPLLFLFAYFSMHKKSRG